jgi:mono/diheme cytochrome c family protein
LSFALLLAVLALSTTGVTEWVREAVRKPFIIYDYMYANNLRVADLARVREQGVLKSARWVRLHEVSPDALKQAGEDVFRAQCASCHTVDGYNGIRLAVKGWSWTMIDYELAHVHQLKGFMPPFVGTEVERKALGLWLGSLNPAPASIEIQPVTPVANSQEIGAAGEGGSLQ